MKKRANLITRVALAATIFVTALAGVTPMTAKAAPVSVSLTKDSVTITANIDPDGGNWSSTAPQNANDFSDTKTTYQLPDVTRDGFTFKEWVSDKPGIAAVDTTGKILTPNFATTESDKTVNIKASWEPVPTTYTINYDSNGGSGSVTQQTVSAGSTHNLGSATTFNPPTNKVFKAWMVNNDAKEKAPGDTITINSNTTIKAIWSDVTLQKIEVTTPPVTSYLAGETFRRGNMVVTATYSNGATADVTDEVSISPTTALTKANTSVTITYQGISCTQAITVNEPAVAAPVFDPVHRTDVSAGQTIKFPTSTSGASVKYYVRNDSWPASYPDATHGDSGDSYTIPSSTAEGTVVYIRAVAYKGTDLSLESSAYFTVTKTANSGGTTATLKSFSWNSGSLDLGGISTGADALHNKTTPDKPALVFPVNSEKQFDNGITRDNIIKEIDKADDLSVTLRVNETDVTFKLDSVKWDYTYTEGANQPLTTSAYNRNETKKQEFYIYSDPLQLKNGNNVYSITSGNLGPATYVRLKLHVVVNAEGEAATNTTTGSGNVAAPTFTPASGAYVHPGQKISFASTTAGVSFRSDSGDKMPTSSSGTSGSQILIPAGASGTYKLNAIAYTGSNNYSPVASATYTVVGSSNANYQITTGDAQQVSATQPASFTFSGDHTKFRQLQVDGVVVPSGYYQVAQGSTVITLQPSYLATLTAGTHTIEAFFDDGYATGSFTLTSGASNTPNTPTNINNPTNSDNSTLPGSRGGNTDDRSQLVIMFVLLGMLIAGFVVSVYYKNEKLRRNRYMD